MRQRAARPGRRRHRAAVLRLRLPHRALAGDAGADRPDPLRRGAAGDDHRLCGVVRPAGARRRGDPAVAARPARRAAGGRRLRHHHPRAGARPGDGAWRCSRSTSWPSTRASRRSIPAMYAAVRGGALLGGRWPRRSAWRCMLACAAHPERLSRLVAWATGWLPARIGATVTALSQVVRRGPGRGARSAPAGPGAGLVGAAVAGHRRADLGGVAGPRRGRCRPRARCWSPRCWWSASRCRRPAPSAAITRPTASRSPRSSPSTTTAPSPPRSCCTPSASSRR